MMFELLRPEYLFWLFKGFLLTLQIGLVVIPAATLLGFLATLAAGSAWRPVAWLATGLVAVLRNSPLLVQLFFWYFGAPALLPDAVREWLNITQSVSLPGGLSLPWPSYEFLCGVLGLTLYSAAFVSEEIRAGMQGVPRTQQHAAEALGMRPWQIFRYVIAPQALRIALPLLMGQYMNIVKNSSLTMAIGVMELSYASRQVETVSFKTFQAFGVATLLYVLIIAVLEAMALLVQHRLPVFGTRR
ncbi:amino acid ABC transporter permease [Uliginosibacterium sp. 31-16]|uniref:amino acid ABC transporter permease n=1 Tax=Uliginosibacterium sp. 31-16 TaxID=3068315 RepID=UPI00273E0986|nr:amino acid ABC transporter permease [Uliginosibacterium sp. 31-16]MDP5240805.1 amino acid ABC transporter permease [Uliginosibacterium sp. 31-16]